MEAPSIVMAFGAGLLSFLSPCVLAIYPSFLSYLTGLSADELANQNREVRWRLFKHALVFVLGFSTIWVALGLTTSALGFLFLKSQGVLRWTGGILMLLMGLVLLGVIRVPFLMREKRIQLATRPSGLIGSYAIGLTFAAGWTPCIGPILTAVLTLAAQNPRLGAPLLLLYSIGFAIPFLVLAYGFGSSRWLLRYTGTFERVGGGIMVVMGSLLLTDKLQAVLGWLTDLTGFSGF